MKNRSLLAKRWQTWWPAAAIAVIGTGLSVLLWQSLHLRQSHTLQERLTQQAHLFASSVEQRLSAYGDMAYAMQPLIEKNLATRTSTFAHSMLVQSLPSRYPGVETLSLARRWDADQYQTHRQHLLQEVPENLRVPEHLMPKWPLERSQYFVIEEVWPPSTGKHLRGLDLSGEPSIELLMHQMRYSTTPLMSAPLRFKQTADNAPGVIIGVPLRAAMPGEEHRTLVGALNVAVRMESMVEHLLERGMLTHAAVSIHDVGDAEAKVQERQATEHGLLYRSRSWADALPQWAKVTHDIQAWGRVWRLEFAPQLQMLSTLERFYPAAVALVSLIATLALAWMVSSLGAQRARAQLQVAARNHLLRERTDRLKALLHQSVIGVAEIEPEQRRYTSANARFSEMLGTTVQALEEMDLYALIHPEDRQACEQLELQLRQGQIPHFNTILRMLRTDGSMIWAEVWVSPLLGMDGSPVGRHLVLMLDVTERIAMQKQLQAREAYSSEMLRYMPVGLVVIGADRRVEFVNQEFGTVTGWTQQELTDECSLWRHLCLDGAQNQKMVSTLEHSRSHPANEGANLPSEEYVLRSREGRELSMDVSVRALGDRVLLSFIDLSQRKEAEAKIRWLGFYDSLTQLPNRSLLMDRLGEVIQSCQTTGEGQGALLLLDIDNFKSLNETLGHQYGDALLRLVATRLSNCIAGKHTLARQGGDEFAVVLEDLPPDSMDAGRRAEQVGSAILEALRTPFYLGNQDFHVTVSMGAVVFDGHGDTVEELLKRADLALYQAKSAGRDTLQFFDPSMQKAVSARVEMEKDIRLALERHEFDLYFQPQVQCDKVIGAEALLRWKHPAKGFIPPSTFVPIAEESGLILPLGEWVLFAACRQLAHWARDPQLQQLTMAVNVSPRQFYQPDFVQQVQRALEVTGARAQLLELELTEGMLLTDVDDTIWKMVQLKELGVMFSLDDFGTGYSSLSYLKRLPLDKLKIDQSFVQEVVDSPNDATIAKSIIALGTSLGLQVIAEGVETEAQRDFLTSNGCHYWQGFLFSRPQAGPEFEAWTKAYGRQSLASVTV